MAYRRSSSPLGACPRCHHPLVEYREFPGIRACEICAGMFADNARSRAIVAALDRALLVLSLTLRATRPPTAQPDHEITCPECQGPMARIAIASAACTIDACGEHGTWFDAGELTRVVAFAASGGLDRTRARESQEQQDKRVDEKARIAWAAGLAASSSRQQTEERLRFWRDFLSAVLRG